MPQPMSREEFRRKRRQALILMWFAVARMTAWILLGVWVFAFDPPLEQSVPLVVFMSLYANVGTEASTAMAALATLRSLENPPA